MKFEFSISKKFSKTRNSSKVSRKQGKYFTYEIEKSFCIRIDFDGRRVDNKKMNSVMEIFNLHSIERQSEK